MPDNALFVPPLVEDSVQKGENLAPRRLGLGGAVASWHGSAATELYRTMEMTFWLPQAQAAVAEVEGR